ncbi:MAG: protein translocase subunit SecD [Alphaproteobacteria bacterium]|nr:protein translocase subunit SecD [Alphaproteobacteria bacterium]MCL2889789.1 protein translocase subunit SecD [Alphaproteobacteria bacterium]
MFKKFIIITIAIIGCLLAVPTIYSPAAKFLPSFIQPISLGLDLRGGAQLLLEVDTEVMFAEKMNQLYDGARTALLRRDKGVIRFSDLRNIGGKVSVVIRDSSDVSAARGRLRSELGDSVDITASGNTITLSYSDKERMRMTEDALNRSIEIVRRRIDALGTKEPSIQTQGGRYIMVQLPGVDNPERIKELIGQTAKMTFHLVNENISREQMASGRPPAGTEFLPLMDDPTQMIPVFSRVEVSGESLTDAQASFDQNNMPVVTQVFDSAGARRFARLTTEHVNERFAIVLDGKVLSAPVIREPIPGGRGQISGNFTVQSAKDLAVLLRSGALPAPLTVIEERTVGAGLGADTIEAGRMGTIIGVLLVILSMLLVYGLFGVFANIALVVNMMMIIGVAALMGATLTLPGIAGIALTLAMAVDANVLQFERIRDELRSGASPLHAVDAGFNRALKTVLDANLTTLIAALVLFQFGAGPIRGFAVTLSIGILTTLFTCVLLSRVMVDIYMGGKNKKIGFVKNKK